MKIEMISLENHMSGIYRNLSDFNISNKILRHSAPNECEERYRAFLKATPEIRAVTVCFSNIEGRLHMLDYDKDFLLDSSKNLTFDGSSIRGFTSQEESDLRLEIDWPSFYLLPWDVFGEGKAFVFAIIRDKDGSAYSADMRSYLKEHLETLKDQKGISVGVAAEIEGFLLEGKNAEKHADLVLVTSGGYYDSLPGDKLRLFIDKVAEVQRAIGFCNEKDHPEVGPSQFEINWSYTDALTAADQMQLYKLIARQVAKQMGYTASFLPKPVVGINGSGMHINISLSSGGENLFYDLKGQDGLSPMGIDFMNGVLANANSLCLIMNSSVNSYRRLDPSYEAPNAIFASAVNRGAMIRIPLANKKSARLEVRAVSPDANPYLLIYAILRAGMSGDTPKIQTETQPLPGDIYTAMECFQHSKFITDILGEENKMKYHKWKMASANRCPRLLGNNIKPGEVLFHHEVTNQALWSNF